ncbi:MAG: OmpA family protein [Paenibacillaceae bacterium]|jgi:chemotaxis protein MotB|nr:OmpA family protein [Paenibacillaceae bacterium]
MGKKHKHDHEEHLDESWLIPYADLLTLLLALFIVLFASSQVDQKKFDQVRLSLRSALDGGTSFFENMNPISSDSDINKSIRSQKTTGPDGRDVDRSQAEKKEQKIKKETEQLQQLKEKLDMYIAKNKLNAELKTVLDRQQLKIVISDTTLFASGSATLKQESRSIAASISTMLEQYKQFDVVVGGHTDNRPINTAQFSSNFHLSAARALNFMMVILENKNVGENRFWSAGYGEYEPVATNDTDSGRARNRRVEVSIVRTVQ